jgi:hypothetical protein
LDIQPKLFKKDCYLKFEEFSPPKKRKITQLKTREKKPFSKFSRRFLFWRKRQNLLKNPGGGGHEVPENQDLKFNF